MHSDWDSDKTISQFHALDKVVYIFPIFKGEISSLFLRIYSLYVCIDWLLLHSPELNNCIRSDSNFFWVEHLLFLHLFFLEDGNSEIHKSVEKKRNLIPGPRAAVSLVVCFHILF